MNYYQVLDISPEASDAEIKAAFKKKAVAYHPDKNAGDPEKAELFKEINEAYQILSDPFERSRYDLKLKYGSTLEYAAYRNIKYYQRYKKRSRYYQGGRIDSRENLVATAYAFAICFGLAMFVVLGLRFVEYYQDWKQELELSERRSIFLEAQSAFQNGQIANALDLLSVFSIYYASERDIVQYKRMVLDHLERLGISAFSRGDHQEALQHFELLKDYRTYFDPDIASMMANCYAQTANYDKSLEILDAMVSNGYRELQAHTEMARIYKEVHQDLEDALIHYEKACDLALADYQATYGKAYGIILNDQFVPIEHFQLFHGLAETHYQMGQYEQSLKVSQWNIAIWPESGDTYLLRGKCFEALGSFNQACMEYKLAKRYGAASPSIC